MLQVENILNISGVDLTRAFTIFKILYWILMIQKLTYIFSSRRRDMRCFPLFQHSFSLQPVALGGLCALSLLNPIIHADCCSATRAFFFFHCDLRPSRFCLFGLFLLPIVCSTFLFSERAIIANIDYHLRMIFQRHTLMSNCHEW